MRNLIVGTAAAAMLAVAAPAAVADKPDKPATETRSASKACKAQRTAVGTAAFAQLHGVNKNRKNAFGKCVSKMSRLDETEQQEVVEASKQCKAERTAMGAEAFAEKYGTNRNKRNAFGKCVSATSSEDEPAPAPAA